jgi:hypothetical protein
MMMIGNFYLYEKFVQGHRYDLLQEAQRQRMLKKYLHHTGNVREQLSGKHQTLVFPAMTHGSEQV